MLKEYAEQEYKYGFVTKIESDTLPPGLNEDVIKFISNKKGEPEWLTKWRLKAYKIWLKMKEPHWANIEYPPIEIDSDIDSDGDINDNITPYDYSQYVCAGESDGFISFDIKSFLIGLESSKLAEFTLPETL